MARDYYDVLGVARDATEAELKKAYRQQARRFHPDVSDAEDAEARFKEVQQAYEVLKDPEKRAGYDQFGPDWETLQTQGDAGHGYEFNFGGGGFSDLFEDLFGMRGAAQPHLRASVQISLEDAYSGAERTLELPPLGPQQSARRLKVRIPKGVQSGQTIRLRGQGARTETGQGDVLLEVQILPHPRFRLEGRDVHVRVPVAPWEAALGRRIRVPTLGGMLEVKVPAGSSTGRKLRLKGRGLPGSPAGDQFVELEIVVPREVPEAARKLYEQLEAVSGFEAREQVDT